MEDFISDEWMNPLVGNNVNVAPQKFAQIRNKTAPVEESRPLAKCHQEVNVARLVFLTARHGTKHANIVTSSPAREGKDLLPVLFEEL
ncbi:hypothetical protein AUJ46_06410 [Candidatus Peregrinibacteria bacterium CG1_02_54_53]|nr:MAG: hypothetical protein AUJ46_06410 [Candidatus Peregrinibacteria bacterium CG1_02_54_53]